MSHQWSYVKMSDLFLVILKHIHQAKDQGYIIKFSFMFKLNEVCRKIMLSNYVAFI